MAEQEQIQAQVQQAVTRQKTGDDVSLKYRGLSYELALELNYYESKYFTLLTSLFTIISYPFK